ncbi:MAG: 2,3-bisphosphoglycerate-independent phosphoglycerate mutase [Ignavibacteriales bacterium]
MEEEILNQYKIKKLEKTPSMLIVLDGFGLNPNKQGNAIKQANTPNFERLYAEYPNTYVETSGMNVGLPEGQMGNSEVGHTNIGAGRIVYQELTRITKSIADGDFFEKPEFINAIENCKNNRANLHLYGLLSNGGVHSHNTHLYALLELAKKMDFNNVFIHCFMDGRDTPPTSGKEYIIELEQKIKEIGVGTIATVIGRYYAMDRDKRWERVSLAYDALVLGKGEYADGAVQAIEESYKKDEHDEFVKPKIILKNDKPVATIKANDSVVFFNFRPDRAREITRSFVDEAFDGFERPQGFFPLYYVCMTEYDAEMPNVEVAFKPEHLNNTFGEYLSELGYTQLRIAETEKYAHVTFFFNGGVEKTYPGEERILIQSPKVSTYDLKPEMSAYEVTDAVIKAVESGKFDVIVMNYANPDMVGHTGIMPAAIKAVEAVDECVGRVVDAVLENGGGIIITADHGNADQMIDYDTKEPFTAHTTKPAPFIVVGYGKDIKLKPGKLCDITPTMLDLMGLPAPPEMTGESLLVKS